MISRKTLLTILSTLVLFFLFQFGCRSSESALHNSSTPETTYLTAVSATGIENDAAKNNFQSKTAAQSINNLPTIILREEWSDINPSGFEANAIRRNIAYQDTLRFQGLTLIVEQMMRSASVPGRLLKYDPGDDEEGDGYSESLSVKVTKNGASELLHFNPGQSMNWHGFHISLQKIDFQNSLADLEIATVGSLPVNRAAHIETGNGEMRLRVKHNLSKIVITQQVTEFDSPEEQSTTVEFLNQLYKKSVEIDNRWDLPHHYYINSEGEIYEARDIDYSGEFKTGLDPRGYLIINLLTSDSQQNIAQLESANNLIHYLSSKHGIDRENLFLLSDLDSDASVESSLDLEINGHSLIEKVSH